MDHVNNKKDRITNNLFESIRQITTSNLSEELKGNQHKIDKNKNGKVDKEDFELLRKKKGEMKEAAFDPMKHIDKDKQTPAIKTAAKDVKRSSYADRAALMKAGGVKDDRGPRGVTQEEVEELDELSKNTLKSYSTKAKKDSKEYEKAGYAYDSDPDERDFAPTMFKKAASRAAGAAKADSKIKEDVDFTIIEHNAFVIELPESLTYVDYLEAARKFVNEENDAVLVAEEFFNDKNVDLVIESFMMSDIEDKVAGHRKNGHTVSMPKFSKKDGQPYAEYTVTDKESGVRRKYIHHGSVRKVENMGAPGKKD
jgi:hypothetical protein